MARSKKTIEQTSLPKQSTYNNLHANLAKLSVQEKEDEHNNAIEARP